MLSLSQLSISFFSLHYTQISMLMRSNWASNSGSLYAFLCSSWSILLMQMSPLHQIVTAEVLARCVWLETWCIVWVFWMYTSTFQVVIWVSSSAFLEQSLYIFFGRSESASKPGSKVCGNYRESYLEVLKDNCGLIASDPLHKCLLSMNQLRTKLENCTVDAFSFEGL